MIVAHWLPAAWEVMSVCCRVLCVCCVCLRVCAVLLLLLLLLLALCLCAVPLVSNTCFKHRLSVRGPHAPGDSTAIRTQKLAGNSRPTAAANAAETPFCASAAFVSCSFRLCVDCVRQQHIKERKAGFLALKQCLSFSTKTPPLAGPLEQRRQPKHADCACFDHRSSALLQLGELCSSERAAAPCTAEAKARHAGRNNPIANTYAAHICPSGCEVIIGLHSRLSLGCGSVVPRPARCGSQAQQKGTVLDRLEDRPQRQARS